MRKLALALLLLVAVSSSAEKADKAEKMKKSKSFAPVVKAAGDYAGSYSGPSESYGLVLESRDGKLGGTYVELGRVAVLHPIDVTGADFTATASFDDGSWRTLKGTFVNRTLNGSTAFGVKLQNVRVEGMGAIDTFFETVGRKY